MEGANGPAWLVRLSFQTCLQPPTSIVCRAAPGIRQRSEARTFRIAYSDLSQLNDSRRVVADQWRFSLLTALPCMGCPPSALRNGTHRFSNPGTFLRSQF